MSTTTEAEFTGEDPTATTVPVLDPAAEQAKDEKGGNPDADPMCMPPGCGN
jgi:hypothetical protein